MIHFLTPFRIDKDLGKAYNESVSLIPNEDHVCLMDYDACFLSPNSIPIIYDYVTMYPDAILTCWQSRGHDIAAQTSKKTEFDLRLLADYTLQLEKEYGGQLPVTEITKHLSGFCLVFPKSLWEEIPFREGIGCLGVDTMWMKDLQAKGKKVYLMERIMALHAYRLNGKEKKEHLL